MNAHTQRNILINNNRYRQLTIGLTLISFCSWFDIVLMTYCCPYQFSLETDTPKLPRTDMNVRLAIHKMRCLSSIIWKAISVKGQDVWALTKSIKKARITIIFINVIPSMVFRSFSHRNRIYYSLTEKECHEISRDLEPLPKFIECEMNGNWG